MARHDDCGVKEGDTRRITSPVLYNIDPLTQATPDVRATHERKVLLICTVRTNRLPQRLRQEWRSEGNRRLDPDIRSRSAQKKDVGGQKACQGRV